MGSFTRTEKPADAPAEASAPTEKAPVKRAATAEAEAQVKAQMQLAGEAAAKAGSEYAIAAGKVVMCRRGALKGAGVAGAAIGGDPITVIDCAKTRSEKDMASGQARLDALIEAGHVSKKI